MTFLPCLLIVHFFIQKLFSFLSCLNCYLFVDGYLLLRVDVILVEFF